MDAGWANLQSHDERTLHPMGLRVLLEELVGDACKSLCRKGGSQELGLEKLSGRHNGGIVHN